MNTNTKGSAMKLTPGFTVTDAQSTPSGYYRIEFRSKAGDYVSVTQHGRGGCNIYQSTTQRTEDAFTVWLGSNDQIAIDSMDRMGFHDLAVTVAERGTEWRDIVVMGILDGVEMGAIPVEG